jgi:hypothetical protein
MPRSTLGGAPAVVGDRSSELSAPSSTTDELATGVIATGVLAEGEAGDASLSMLVEPSRIVLMDAPNG